MERPAVIRYRNFADILRLKVGRPLATDGMFIEFGIPMPASWSEKRKERAEGTPHQQRPDLSNLLKAVEDALNEKDEWIWQFRGLRKIWRREGYVYLQWPET